MDRCSLSQQVPPVLGCFCLPPGWEREGTSLSAKAEVKVVSGPDWGFARAELGTTMEGFCSQGDPNHCLP